MSTQQLRVSRAPIVGRLLPKGGKPVTLYTGGRRYIPEGKPLPPLTEEEQMRVDCANQTGYPQAALGLRGRPIVEISISTRMQDDYKACMDVNRAAQLRTGEEDETGWKKWVTPQNIAIALLSGAVLFFGFKAIKRARA